MKKSAAALLLAMAPIMGPVMAETLPEIPPEGPKILQDIGIGMAELRSGTAWTAPDGSVRFTSAVAGADMIRISDLVLTDQMRETRFDRFDVSLSDASVTFAGMLSRSILDENSGSLRISSGSFSNESLASVLLGGDLCPPIGTALSQDHQLEIALEGIELQAMATAALEPRAGTSVTGRSARPETIGITGLTATFLGSAEPGCVAPEGVSLTGTRISAVDGDVGVIDAISILSHPVATADAPFRLAVEAEGLRVSDAAGTPVSQADRAGLTLEVGAQYAAAMATAIATGTEPTPTEAFRVMAADTLRIEGHVEGLLLPLADFLPQDIGVRLAVPEGHMVTGGMAFAAGTKDGVLGYSHEIDLAGLARSTAHADFTFGDGANAAAIGSLVEDNPEIAMAAYLMLKGASFSYEDLGIGPMVEAGTGLTPAEAVDLLRKRAEPVPAAIADPVFAWLRETATRGGKVVVAPDAPVGLVEIGMMGMMNPAGLPALLKLSYE